MTSVAPTEVESFLIRESVMLPHLIQMLNNNIENKLKKEGLGKPLQEFYIGLTKAMILKIDDDLATVRKTLRELGIKVWEEKEKADSASIYYRYVCRGYEHELAIIRKQGRAELKEKLGKYASKMEAQMKLSN